MYLTLKRDWEVIDGSNPNVNKPAVIPVGRHEIEEIPNPYGYKAPWWVLKGTKIGAPIGSWRQWVGKKYDDFEVMIEE